MTEKKKIKIIKVPAGPDIPEEVRKGWVGVTFSAVGPVQDWVCSIEGRGLRMAMVYKADARQALEALKQNNEDSWRWFQENTSWGSGGEMNFLAEDCEEVDSEEI